MHELSIALELWRLCRAESDERSGLRVLNVHIAVGELASIDPTLLEYAWNDVAAGARGAAPKLVVDWCPAHQVCARCGEIAGRQPGSWMRLCPECEAPLRVEGGGELDLLEIEFEEPQGAATC